MRTLLLLMSCILLAETVLIDAFPPITAKSMIKWIIVFGVTMAVSAVVWICAIIVK